MARRRHRLPPPIMAKATVLVLSTVRVFRNFSRADSGALSGSVMMKTTASRSGWKEGGILSHFSWKWRAIFSARAEAVPFFVKW